MEKPKDIVVLPERSPYSGKSLRMSESTRKADTPAENELQNLISAIRPRVSAKYNERLPVEGEREDSALFPDALIDGWLALEAEGAGSGSMDNDERDEALAKMGLRVVHLPNRVIFDYAGKQVIAQFVILAAELHSALLRKGPEIK